MILKRYQSDIFFVIIKMGDIMNDDLLDYLIATDSIDEFLGLEVKCPNCGMKLIETKYKNVKNKIQNKPLYHCNNCHRSYYKNLKDYIIEDIL